MADVFVSYSHDDRIRISRLVRALESDGLSVWWDRETAPGELWDQVIARELRNAGCVIVAWSSSSIGSVYVREEAGLALANEKLLPVSLDQSAPPKFFKGIEVVDLSRWLGSTTDPNYERVKLAAFGLIGRSPENMGADKINKNRSSLKVWGLTIGGTFFGFATGVIAMPTLAVLALVATIAVPATYFYTAPPSLTTAPSLPRSSEPPRVERDAPAVVFNGHDLELTSAEFSPDNMRIVTASRDKTARVWDARSGLPLAVLSGHTDVVTSAVFAPDGTQILTASIDGTFRLWDAATSKTQAVIDLKRGVTGAHFWRDGSLVVTSLVDGYVNVSDTSGRSLLMLRTTDGANATVFAWPAGDKLLIASGTEADILTELAAGKSTLSIATGASPIARAAFSADGRRFVTVSADRTATVWDATTGVPLRTFHKQVAGVTSVVFSGDGQSVLTASEDGTARVWNVSDGRQTRLIRASSEGLASAVFSADGRIIVTASKDKTARAWRID